MRKNILRKRKDTIIKEFVNYVYDFYGKGGVYDMGATVSQITTATIDINLMRIFSEGPLVSLNGSPIVSPITAASCA